MAAINSSHIIGIQHHNRLLSTATRLLVVESRSGEYESWTSKSESPTGRVRFRARHQKKTGTRDRLESRIRSSLSTVLWTFSTSRRLVSITQIYRKICMRKLSIMCYAIWLLYMQKFWSILCRNKFETFFRQFICKLLTSEKKTGGGFVHHFRLCCWLHRAACWLQP